MDPMRLAYDEGIARRAIARHLQPIRDPDWIARLAPPIF
jgi:hypothetical protein